MQSLQIKQLFTGLLMREGAGVKLNRYLGVDRRNDYEPFLLFDYFDSTEPMDYQAGFPPHPHRGFETITYVLKGRIAHEDNKGHRGSIVAGDVQWMTAGRGLVHSEMPVVMDEGLTGLQLWLNLPAKSKMCPPAYQEFTDQQLPIEQHDNGTIIKVIAGKTSKGTQSPLLGIATEPIFLDIVLPANQIYSQFLSLTHQTLVFVLQGELKLEDQTIKEKQLAALTEGERLTLKSLHHETRFLLIAAKKLQEPIARLGPFVMNTPEEINQALEDFRNNQF